MTKPLPMQDVFSPPGAANRGAASGPFVPVCSPVLPVAREILPYLERIDAARYYTNHGPLVQELRSRLAQHFGVDAARLVLASNGTAALVGAIFAAAGRGTGERPYCLCPSYTFVATAIAAASCGFEPYFLDAEPDSWALAPGRTAGLPELRSAGIIIAAAPYGRKPDLAGWNDLASASGVPVIVDAAACFDTLDRQQIASSRIPVMVSLHATKTLSTAEGGVVICPDGDFAERVTRALNFGFYGSRQSHGPSTNGKMSEYHAAVGLADFDRWPAKRQGFIATAQAYSRLAQARGIGASIVSDCGNANPYALHVAKNAGAADAVIAALRQQNIETRRWYEGGNHLQPAFADCRSEAMAVTKDISARIIGLPFGPCLDEAIIARVVSAIAAASGGQGFLAAMSP